VKEDICILLLNEQVESEQVGTDSGIGVDEEHQEGGKGDAKDAEKATSR
jgi:hypothetical protein